MGWIKNTLFSTLFLASILFPKVINSQSISWHVHDSENGIPGANCPVSAIRISPPDTCYQTTNNNGRCTFSGGDFNPPLQIGQHLNFVANKDTNSSKHITETNWVVRDGFYPNHNFLLENCLDNPLKNVVAHTINLSVVVDTSGWSTGSTFYALSALYKNPSQVCTTIVDTANSISHRYDVFDLNFENQDSLLVNGDSAWVKLTKTKGDTTLQTLIKFIIEDSHINSQLIKSNGNTGSDTTYFPIERIVNDQTPPSFDNVTEWPNTSWPGPFDVDAYITDGAGIDSSNTLLRWYMDSDSTNAWADSIKNDTFFFNIDTTLGGVGTINYQIKALDESENQNVTYWPGPSSDEWHTFTSTPTGIQETMTDFSARTIEDVVNLGVRLDFMTNQTGIIDIDKNGKDLTRIITEPNKVNYTFVDSLVEEGRNYNYQAIFNNDTLNATVYVPYVNFNATPTITNGKVKISGAKEVDVYDLSGRKVAEYSNKNSSSTGTYDFDVPQGIYFVRPKGSDSKEETKKVVNVR